MRHPLAWKSITASAWGRGDSCIREDAAHGRARRIGAETVHPDAGELGVLYHGSVLIPNPQALAEGHLLRSSASVAPELLDDGADAGEGVVHEFLVDREDVGVIVIERRPSDVRPRRQLAHRDAAQALLGKEIEQAALERRGHGGIHDSGRIVFHVRASLSSDKRDIREAEEARQRGFRLFGKFSGKPPPHHFAERLSKMLCIKLILHARLNPHARPDALLEEGDELAFDSLPEQMAARAREQRCQPIALLGQMAEHVEKLLFRAVGREGVPLFRRRGDHMGENVLAKLVEQGVLRLEVRVERRASDVRGLDDVADRYRRIALLSQQLFERAEDGGSALAHASIH